PGLVEGVAAVCGEWELAFAAIGEVTTSGDLRAFFGGELRGEIPAHLLTDECPRYEVEQRPRSLSNAPIDPANVESKGWICEQYEPLVGSRTVRRPRPHAARPRL